tara:strand:+ start:593 stop:799 length:207 start_codon:yes stop_codon:yes gene_type:complete
LFLVLYRGGLEYVGKKESRKYKSAEPNIIQKSLKTPLPITVFTEIKLIDGCEGRGAKAKIKNNAKAQI